MSSYSSCVKLQYFLNFSGSIKKRYLFRLSTDRPVMSILTYYDKSDPNVTPHYHIPLWLFVYDPCQSIGRTILLSGVTWKWPLIHNHLKITFFKQRIIPSVSQHSILTTVFFKQEWYLIAYQSINYNLWWWLSKRFLVTSCNKVINI